MKARVRAEYFTNAMRACGGTLFVKDQWTTVQPEHEKSALVNADLEILDEDKPTAAKFLDAIEPQPTAKEHLKKARSK